MYGMRRVLCKYMIVLLLFYTSEKLPFLNVSVRAHIFNSIILKPMGL